MICSPNGMPLLATPAGTESAGCPVRLRLAGVVAVALGGAVGARKRAVGEPADVAERRADEHGVVAEELVHLAHVAEAPPPRAEVVVERELEGRLHREPERRREIARGSPARSRGRC